MHVMAVILDHELVLSFIDILKTVYLQQLFSPFSVILVLFKGIICYIILTVLFTVWNVGGGFDCNRRQGAGLKQLVADNNNRTMRQYIFSFPCSCSSEHV